jgi:VID27 C-terminal WD40-like domain
MVFSRIKTMLRGRTEFMPCGVLYCGKKAFLDNASIGVEEDSIVISTAEKKRLFPLSSLSALEFTESSEGTTILFKDPESSWAFLFMEGVPASILNFYKNVSDLIPEINQWIPIHQRDHVRFLVYSHGSGEYQEMASSATVRIMVSAKGPFLHVSDLYKVYRRRDYIEKETEFYMDQKTLSFTWGKREKQEYSAFRLVFGCSTALLAFMSAYINCTLSREATREDKEYFEKMEIDNYAPELEDLEISDLSGEEEEEDGESSSEERVSRCRKKEVSAKRDVAGNNFGGRTKEKNKLLAVGKDKFFVSRGSSIGVFRRDEDDADFVTSIRDTTVKGKSIVPRKMLLSQDERSLVMAEMESPESLHRLDLETGKVAETWDTKRKINDFFSSSKSPEGVPTNREFIGISDSSIFKIDPRSAEIVEGKTYATPTLFRSGDSTNKGEFAVGSAKGEIRMYDKIDKRAKTLLPGLGDPIISLFVSPSGRYMVGTCKTYLILVSASVGEKSGFSKSLGQDKPVPKKLHVRPEHVRHLGGEVNFTEATISTDAEEQNIMVSTGSHVILWDLKRALRGDIYSYKVKGTAQAIVANSFVPGNRDKIVIAMQDDVCTIDRKNIKSAPFSKGK